MFYLRTFIRGYYFCEKIYDKNPQMLHPKRSARKWNFRKYVSANVTTKKIRFSKNFPQIIHPLIFVRKWYILKKSIRCWVSANKTPVNWSPHVISLKCFILLHSTTNKMSENLLFLNDFPQIIQTICNNLKCNFLKLFIRFLRASSVKSAGICQNLKHCRKIFLRRIRSWENSL